MPARLLAIALLAAAASGCADDRRDASASGVSTAGTFRADAPASTAGTAVTAPATPEATALLADLDARFSPARTLGYDAARDALYAYEARMAGGTLCEVYAGACGLLGAGDPSKAAGDIGINAEHTWPQSYGARDEPLRSDLHHLFPALANVNSSRGNLPLADVPDVQAQAWYRDRASSSRLPPGEAPGAWSQRGAGRFEPRDAHKGNAARALFYVVATYPEVLARPDAAAFFETMREDLLRWNRLDPPDDAERARSTWIARLQGTENPFVLDPGLAERAFAAPVSSTSPVPAARPAPAAARDVWLAALHYDNAGADVNEGVQVAGPPGASLAGWQVALVNGSDGRVYRTVPLGGVLGADGRRWVGIAGIQNGSPDGVALVAPGGAVAEFWSYEGTFTATDGPAAGMRGRAMEAEQSGREPSGTALVRGAPDAPWRVGPHPLGR